MELLEDIVGVQLGRVVVLDVPVLREADGDEPAVIPPHHDAEQVVVEEVPVLLHQLLGLRRIEIEEPLRQIHLEVVAQVDLRRPGDRRELRRRLRRRGARIGGRVRLRGRGHGGRRQRDRHRHTQSQNPARFAHRDMVPQGGSGENRALIRPVLGPAGRSRVTESSEDLLESRSVRGALPGDGHLVSAFGFRMPTVLEATAGRTKGSEAPPTGDVMVVDDLRRASAAVHRSMLTRLRRRRRGSGRRATGPRKKWRNQVQRVIPEEPGSAEISVFLENFGEPEPGIEPGTYGLRNRCSTTELLRRRGSVITPPVWHPSTPSSVGRQGGFGAGGTSGRVGRCRSVRPCSCSRSPPPRRRPRGRSTRKPGRPVVPGHGPVDETADPLQRTLDLLASRPKR